MVVAAVQLKTVLLVLKTVEAVHSRRELHL